MGKTKNRAVEITKGVWRLASGKIVEQLCAFKGEIPDRQVPKIEQELVPLPVPDPAPRIRQLDIFEFMDDGPREYNPLLAMPVCPCP